MGRRGAALPAAAAAALPRREEDERALKEAAEARRGVAVAAFANSVGVADAAAAANASAMPSSCDDVRALFQVFLFIFR